MSTFDPNNLPRFIRRADRSRVQNPNDYEEVLAHRVHRGELTSKNISDILDRADGQTKMGLELKVAEKERERAHFQRINGEVWDKKLPDGTLATDWRELEGTRHSDNP